MATGTLTALQLDAAAGLLQNQGIGINANLIASIDSYTGTSLISPLLSTIASNTISANTSSELKILAANSCPALSDSVPTAYSSLGTQMTVVVLNEANIDICGNNVSKLAQAVNQADGYTSQTSTFITSAVNSQTYLGNTFTSMNNMITGDVTSINLVTSSFGSDLANLGFLINLKNLDNLGSPLALVQQIYAIAGVVPSLSASFIAGGVPKEVVVAFTDPTASVADSIQALMYQTLTQITGTGLQQILSILRVTTTGINTAADLLNPYKLFPNSFQTLTVPTAKGTVAVYLDSIGTVNTELVQLLPPYVVSSLV